MPMTAPSDVLTRGTQSMAGILRDLGQWMQEYTANIYGVCFKFSVR